VRVIDADGSQVGVLPIQEALRLAEERELDLVEVAPNANPPVCRIMDYGKYKYEQAKKEKEARKKQRSLMLKEVRLSPKIDEHDYQVKIKHIREFLEKGHRVKVVLMFRGREITHIDLAKRLLDRAIADVENIAIVEQKPRMEGRRMIMSLVPKGGG